MTSIVAKRSPGRPLRMRSQVTLMKGFARHTKYAFEPWLSSFLLWLLPHYISLCEHISRYLNLCIQVCCNLICCFGGLGAILEGSHEPNKSRMDVNTKMHVEANTDTHTHTHTLTHTNTRALAYTHIQHMKLTKDQFSVNLIFHGDNVYTCKRRSWSQGHITDKHWGSRFI